MSDLQMPPIKKLKMFIFFVSMATELPDRQRFYKIQQFQAFMVGLVICKNEEDPSKN